MNDCSVSATTIAGHRMRLFDRFVELLSFIRLCGREPMLIDFDA